MRKVREIDPRLRLLQLSFALSDSWMDLLSANAWKVVSYVAAQCLRLHAEQLLDPAMAALNRDLDGIGVPLAPPGKDERPYRVVSSDLGEAQRLAVLSLDQICHGARARNRRFQDYGTGLSKSSAAAAINEALQADILVRKPRQSPQGRDLASLYGINWDRVLELDWRRKKGKRRVRLVDTSARQRQGRRTGGTSSSPAP